MITNYGYPLHTSIVYTDSIPLLALFFKCFAAYLPPHFQYFGLWYGLCFFLQGSIAWILSARMTNQLIVRLSITFFFLLSPIMLNRLVEHQALVAHWVILTAYGLYWRSTLRRVHFYWLLLNTMTVLIHAYLAFMVIAIWVGAMIKAVVVERAISLKKAGYIMALNLAVMILAAWISGYFVIPLFDMADPGGYTVDSLNLLAPWMPGEGSLIAPGGWSRWLPLFKLRFLEQGIEGFNYFGVGMMLLLLCAIGCMIKRPPRYQQLFPWLPLICMNVLLLVYALSNVVYLGETVLFTYPSLFWINWITDLFRASGRFFWPCYYFIMLGTFSVLCHRLSPRWLIGLFSVALLLQGMDLSFKVRDLHRRFTEPLAMQTLPFQAIDRHYRHLVFLPFVSRPSKLIQQFGGYIHYAANHDMSVNLGYFARQDNGAFLRLTQETLRALLLQGQLSQDTVYVVLDPHLAKRLQFKFGPQVSAVPMGKYIALLPTQQTRLGDVVANANGTR